jgi:hypothetical protein
VKTVTIGGAAGMWGDSCLATPQLLADGRCRYLIYEALAEVTMAILTKARRRDPEQGYARDVIAVIGEHLARLSAQRVRVVTNAGGINPPAAAAALRRAAEVAGVPLSVATVTGDDLMPRLDRMRAVGVREMTTGAPVAADPISCNAYLGARPIAAALDAGADIVVTGRCVDSALVLGPLIHEFGWRPDELDLLSAGSLAGHLLECGPQSTGGLLTDWRDTASWATSGFPIAEVAGDGGFVLTTARDSDALVDRRTVTEQLLYEIGDPTRYLLPDVTCDWTGVTVTDVGPDRVAVTGARGRAPSPTLKACAQLADGHRAQVVFFLGGRDAVAKAERVGRDVLARAARILAARGFAPFRATAVDVVGGEGSYGPHTRARDTREVVLRIGVHHDEAAAVTAFVREFPSIGLAGPPGLGTFIAGLPAPSPLLRLESYLVPRELVPATVELDGAVVAAPDVPPSLCRPGDGTEADAPAAGGATGESGTELPLIAVAHGRSGDKGDTVNIGIVARDPAFEPILHAQVTTERVAEYLGHLGASRVQRFVLPGSYALNFLLHDALGGGGASSLRLDPQGKAVAQQLLELPVHVPDHLLDHPALRVPEGGPR